MTADRDHTHGTKRRALISTIAIMGSRVMGLVREQVFAFFFGAGAVLDAFIVAFRIPNLLRDLFAEGALSQSFVAIFSHKLARGDEQSAYRLANKTLAFVFLLMCLFVALGIILAPRIVSIIATGFDEEKFALTVRLMRILFPFILFVSLAAVMMGVLHAKNKFFIPHSASTFFNITSIIVGLICAFLFAPDYIHKTFQKIGSGKTLLAQDYLSVSQAIVGMAIGTVLGGLAQLLVQLPTAVKLGYRPKLDFKLKDAGLARVLKLTGPAIIGGAAVQVNVLVNTEFASFLVDGSISWLSFAFRFMQFPLGVFGVAVATASAPVLAKMIAQKRKTEFLESIQASIQLSLFLSIPSAIGLIIIGRDIIALIYEHGHFTHTDTIQTAWALAAYALGITSYSLIKIYQPAYLAFEDARTPMKISLFSIIANAAINAWFLFGLGLAHWALALGTAIVAAMNLVLLALFFGKKLKGVWSTQVWQDFLKILLTALIMGVGLWYFQQYLRSALDSRSLMNRIYLVFIPILISTPIYFGLGAALGIRDARFLLRRIFKSFKK